VLCSAISQTSEGNRIYVLSREEPPPELARPRANCKLYILGWEHLRLKPAETRGVAQKITRKTLPDEVLADLQAKTDGWVAGLLYSETRCYTPFLSSHEKRKTFHSSQP